MAAHRAKSNGSSSLTEARGGFGERDPAISGRSSDMPTSGQLEKIENYKTNSSKSLRFLQLTVLDLSLSWSFGRLKAGNVRRKGVAKHPGREVSDKLLRYEAHINRKIDPCTKPTRTFAAEALGPGSPVD